MSVIASTTNQTGVEEKTFPSTVDSSEDMGDVHNSIFFTAISTTRMPIILTNPRLDDNPICFANPAFLEMTGYDLHEILGHNCRFLQGPETDREIVNQIKTSIQEQNKISVEILNYKKNGSSFWNALFISPVFNKDGELLHFFASQLDVTRRKDAEDALRQSQKMEAVGQLTGGIAHDFNNLLTVTQGYAEMLKAGLDSDNFNLPKAKKAVDAILQATERGSSLTSQLLAFARKQKLQGRVVNLADLVDKLYPLIEQSLGSYVDIVVEHRSHELCNTRIDPVQAELAIINVAVNARDAMSGHGLLTMTTNSHKIDSLDNPFGITDLGDYVSLTISDNGTGMAPETLQRITEPFFTTKSEGRGTGLGMSMVYGFVEQSGGIMKIDSEVGRGTDVRMLFKCDKNMVEVANVKAHKFPLGRKGERETILVVEDKLAVAEYAEEVLIEFGYSVLRANNATEALSILDRADEVDMVFSDIKMPGALNGVQLAREISIRYPKIKILLTTGYTDANIDITDSFGVAFDLIDKPYKRAILIKNIRTVLDGPDGVS